MAFGWPDFEKIDTAALQRIVDEGITESVTHEYKGSGLDLDVDKGKADLAKEAAALANTYGGCIFLGVDEVKGGRAAPNDDLQVSAGGARRYEAPGIVVDAEDALIRRLTDIIHSRTTPRITAVHVRFIDAPGGVGRKVVLIGLPRSWAAPHAVDGRTGGPRYYHRVGVENLEMEPQVLRRAFLDSEDIPNAARRRMDERLGNILSGQGPVEISGSSYAVLQLTPKAPDAGLDIAAAREDQQFRSFSGHYSRPTLEGVMCADGQQGAPARFFSHLQENGAFDALMMLPIEASGSHRPPFVKHEFLVKELLRNLRTFVGLASSYGAVTPLVGRLVVVGVRGSMIWMEGPKYERGYNVIHQDPVVLPEFVIERLDDVDVAAKFWLDCFWRVAGLPRFPMEVGDDGRLPIA